MAARWQFGTIVISDLKKELEAKIAKHHWKLLYTGNGQDYLKFLNMYALNNIILK